MADIEAEREAINQYKMHIKMINDDCVNAVLARIIKDEEYHIMILQSLQGQENKKDTFFWKVSFYCRLYFAALAFLILFLMIKAQDR